MNLPLKHLVLFGAVSVVIFEARPGSIPIALAAAALAAVVAHRLPRRRGARLRPLGVLRFIPFFLTESLRGGVDVALRAFRGPASLRPGFVEFPLRLRTPAARVLFVNSVSLMPGTFTARLDGRSLRVHALDVSVPLEPRLRALEDRVMDMIHDAGAGA